jgi:ribosomal protein S18 acetylase RimI-like enzyme
LIDINTPKAVTLDTLADTQPIWLAKIQFRHVTQADLLALEWEGEYAHFRKVYAQAYQRMLQGLSVLWVAELPGKPIIGQVFVQLECDRPILADGRQRAYMYSFRVRPDYRSAGVGTHLLNVVIDDLRRRGFNMLTLNVAKDNPRAQKFYERHGFTVVAHEPGIWSFPDENGIWQQVEEPAWRMERKL